MKVAVHSVDGDEDAYGQMAGATEGVQYNREEAQIERHSAMSIRQPGRSAPPSRRSVYRNDDNVRPSAVRYVRKSEQRARRQHERVPFSFLCQ